MKNFLKNGGLVLAGSLASVSAANAALDPLVVSSIQDAGTDAASVGGAVLLVIIGIAAFKYIRRAI